MQTTFDDLKKTNLSPRFQVETREDYLESLFSGNSDNDNQINRISFKGSLTFLEILKRMLSYYGRRLIPFEDIYFNGIFNYLLPLISSLKVAKNTSI